MAEAAQNLEIRAAEQRRQLHQSVTELKGAIRSKLDVKANAREYLLPASVVLGGIGLIAGYVLLGPFMPHRRSGPAVQYYPE